MNLSPKRLPCCMLLLFFASTACQTKNEEHADHWRPHEFSEASCEPNVKPMQVGGHWKVHIRLGKGVDKKLLLEQTQSAAAFFRPYGVSFETQSDKNISYEYVIEGAGDTRRAEELMTWSGPIAKDEFQVVLVKEISTPRSALRFNLPELAGFTLKNESAAEVGMEGEIMPTIFLDATELRLLPDMLRRTTLAHEIGHLLGGEHPKKSGVPSGQLLMSPMRKEGCVPSFQLAASREGQ